MASYETYPSKADDAEVNIDDFSPVTAYPGRRTDGTRNEATRVRRLFSFAQIFFFALTFMSSWETMALNLSAVLYNGGPQTLAWGILVVAAGALAQSASLAEMPLSAAYCRSAVSLDTLSGTSISEALYHLDARLDHLVWMGVAACWSREYNSIYAPVAHRCQQSELCTGEVASDIDHLRTSHLSRAHECVYLLDHTVD